MDNAGIVYEAQLSNSDTGEYHGYPMKVDDGFTAFIAPGMGAAWNMTLDITTEWSQEPGRDLTEVPGTVAEDEASLSEIRIRIGETLLTRALDVEMMEMRGGGTLSAYRMAEWLTWNWWRLLFLLLGARPP